MAIVAVVFGLTYAVGSALRGHVLSGIVTGVIAALLVYLVLTRVQAYNDESRRRRERGPD
jgi:uncharacterized membrane protein YfcA